MINVQKNYYVGDMVHCTELSPTNVEGLILGEKYRIVSRDFVNGEYVYGLMDKQNNLTFATASFIGYITEKVNKPVAKKDAINPDHYKSGGIETIDYMKAKMSPEEFRGYLRGNVLKYVSRVGKKDDIVQELEKAQWYLNKLISEYKKDKVEVVVEEDVEEIGSNPMTKRQQQFIAGLCSRLGLDRTNLPHSICEVTDYHDLTESQATLLIEKLLQM